MRLALALFLILGLAGAARADNKSFAPGMEAMYVRAIQEELTRHGYYHGPIDGQPGSKTRQAIRAWQHATGRKVDGVPTAAMVDALHYGAKPPAAGQRAGPSPGPAPAPVVGADPAVDGEVAAAQKLMAIEGYYSGAVDGRAGPQTQDAVKQWQEDHGMARTGEVDAALLMSLAKTPTALPEPPTVAPAPTRPSKPSATKTKP
jgi:peptidoglycan hydrolase-like protein with peptidoglycan-binding domain